jgi:hypothetical protein
MHRSQSGVPTALLLLAPLALAIVVDFFSLRLSEPMWLQVVSAVLLISLFPLGAWATYRSLAATQASSAFHLSAPWRQLASVLLSALWTALALILFVNAHLTFGGSL